MPIRIGFSQYRSQALEAELVRITSMMPQLGVQQSILIGDLPAGTVGPQSSLDFVVVMDIPGNFTRRMDFFTSHLWPTVATNFFVYTPAEFQSLKDTNPFLRNAIRKGRVVHDS